jgi:hypothetical protein
MKKLFFAAALAVMSLLFVGCSKENGSGTQLAEKLMGRWIVSATDDTPALTNSKVVYNYVSATKAYLSASFNAVPERGTIWVGDMEADVVIRGSRVTVTYHPDENTTTVHDFSVRAISESEMFANAIITVTTNGVVILSEQGSVRFNRVNEDYSEAILGLWEGQMVSPESAYDDGQEHRWLYKEDGTFVFYLKNDKGIWEAKDDEYCNYFVAGNLLCTRWKNAGEGTQEAREWWEITAIGKERMVWTALRERKDGTRYTAAFSMERIDVPSQAEIEKAIVGKWMNAEMNGVPSLTNDKGVYTFISTTSAYMSASVKGKPGLGDLWHNFVPLDVNIKDNEITLTHQLDEHRTMTIEMTVTSINDESMHADVHATLTVDGTVVGSVNDHILYEKVKERFQKPIVGLWEGRRTSGGSTEYHRWEYLSDGTYNFYLKEGEGQWVKMKDEFSEYFVDGRLLCTRWKNAGEGTQENREWWEVRSIENDAMIWTALRQDEQGDRYVESFAMHRVKVPTEAEIRAAIKSSKWMTEKVDGEEALTNQKAVFTFISRTQAAVTASIDDPATGGKDWICQRVYEYDVDGNIITLTHEVDEHTTLVDLMIVGAIDNESLHCILYHTEYVDGVPNAAPQVTLELRKQDKTPVKYPAYILGAWQGRVTSERSAYDDGRPHRWEFNGSSYIYYVQNGLNWVPSTNTVNEYFIDGSLLLMRWVDNGVEYREWWEIIALDNFNMVWGATRLDENGQRYPATVTMERIDLT